MALWLELIPKILEQASSFGESSKQLLDNFSNLTLFDLDGLKPLGFTPEVIEPPSTPSPLTPPASTAAAAEKTSQVKAQDRTTTTTPRPASTTTVKAGGKPKDGDSLKTGSSASAAEENKKQLPLKVAIAIGAVLLIFNIVLCVALRQQCKRANQKERATDDDDDEYDVSDDDSQNDDDDVIPRDHSAIMLTERRPMTSQLSSDFGVVTVKSGSDASYSSPPLSLPPPPSLTPPPPDPTDQLHAATLQRRSPRTPITVTPRNPPYATLPLTPSTCRHSHVTQQQHHVSQQQNHVTSNCSQHSPVTSASHAATLNIRSCHTGSTLQNHDGSHVNGPQSSVDAANEDTTTTPARNQSSFKPVFYLNTSDAKPPTTTCLRHPNQTNQGAQGNHVDSDVITEGKTAAHCTIIKVKGPTVPERHSSGVTSSQSNSRTASPVEMTSTQV